MKNPHKIPYALRDGRMLHIEQVVRGADCHAVCPQCQAPVIAKQGTVQAHHFAHASGHECVGAAEGTLHRLAKQILAECDSLMLPALGSQPRRRVSVLAGQIEQSFGGFRADVGLQLAEAPHHIAIEITVSHGIDAQKHQRIHASTCPVLEIQLPTHYLSLRPEALQHYLCEEWRGRVWHVDHQTREAVATAPIPQTAPAKPPAPPAPLQSAPLSPPAASFMLNIDPLSLTEGLNPAQKKAVTAPPEHRLVLAGAGSGKTRVLTHRIGWLMAQENCPPHCLLAVTFTNKAANEMRERLEKLLNTSVRSMWVGTFHGIANRLLRQHWQAAKLGQNFQILDSDDQLRLIKRVLKELNISEETLPPRTAATWINQQKEEARRPRVSNDFSSEAQLGRVYAAYESLCQQQDTVDFAELLLRTYEMLRDTPELQAHYQNKFRHILVDEFQDTNTLQYQLIKLMAGKNGRVFCVGDDDQSIYGFRGAKIENIQKLEKDFEGCQIIRLEQNYRSTSNILNAANGLISQNSGRLGKKLWTDGGAGEKIQVFAGFNEYDEAEFVVSQVQQQLRQGRKPSDAAILYRSNAQSRVLEEILIRNRVPYKIYGGLRFFERAEIKDALAWLRLLHNRHDDVSFERAIGTPPSGVGATSLDKLRALAREQQQSLWQAGKLSAQLLGRGGTALVQFMDTVDALSKLCEGQPLGEVIKRLLLRVDFQTHYQKEGREAAQTRSDNQKELINAAQAFEDALKNKPDAGDPLSEFLTYVALESGEGQAKEHESAVQLMTLHAAKGLEFPLVFMVGMEHGLFPMQRAMDDGNLEEERRLCYVGITRARQRLWLCYAESRRLYGKSQNTMPSGFLQEIPAECLTENRPRAGIQRPYSAERTSRSDERGQSYGQAFGQAPAAVAPRAQGFGVQMQRSAPPATAGRPPAVAPIPAPSPAGFHIGQRLSHPRFGAGTVKGLDGTRIKILFDSVGLKELVLGMTQLSKL